MQIEVIVVSPFQQNCHIVICEKTKQAVIIDPGDEAARILQKIAQLQILPQAIWATHAHIDHISAVAPVQEKLQLPFYMHKGDKEMLAAMPALAEMYEIQECRIPRVDKFVEDGEALSVGKLTAKVIHTPGHSPGNISFLIGNDLFCGDLLFQGAVGRTDLPGGSLSVLRKSLREKILTLPFSTTVHPGHGPTTTVGEEAAWLQEFVQE